MKTKSTKKAYYIIDGVNEHFSTLRDAKQHIYAAYTERKKRMLGGTMIIKTNKSGDILTVTEIRIDGKIREYKRKFKILEAEREAETNECAERIKRIIEETRDVNERIAMVRNKTGCNCKFIQTQKGKVGTVFKRSKELLIQLSARDENARAWVAVIQRDL